MGQDKQAVDPRLRRLLKQLASGKKAGTGGFKARLRQVKKNTRTKQASGGAFLRTKIREEGFSPAIIPKTKIKPWEERLTKAAAASSVLSILTKLGNNFPSPVGSLTELSKIEGTRSQVNEASSKLASVDLREKIASEMLRLDSEVRGHRKRAHALKLLYKQAELGVTQLPQTFSDLEEKLAALVREDLTVLERALELTGGTAKLGELCETEAQALNASEKFQAVVLGDEA